MASCTISVGLTSPTIPQYCSTQNTQPFNSLGLPISLGGKSNLIYLQQARCKHGWLLHSLLILKCCKCTLQLWYLGYQAVPNLCLSLNKLLQTSISNNGAAGCCTMFTPESTGNYGNIASNCINHCVCTVQDIRSSMLGVQYCYMVKKYTNDCLNKLLICNSKR